MRSLSRRRSGRYPVCATKSPCSIASCWIWLPGLPNIIARRSAKCCRDAAARRRNAPQHSLHAHRSGPPGGASTDLGPDSDPASRLSACSKRPRGLPYLALKSTMRELLRPLIKRGWVAAEDRKRRPRSAARRRRPSCARNSSRAARPAKSSRNRTRIAALFSSCIPGSIMSPNWASK